MVQCFKRFQSVRVHREFIHITYSSCCVLKLTQGWANQTMSVISSCSISFLYFWSWRGGGATLLHASVRFFGEARYSTINHIASSPRHEDWDSRWRRRVGSCWLAEPFAMQVLGDTNTGVKWGLRRRMVPADDDVGEDTWDSLLWDDSKLLSVGTRR